MASYECVNFPWNQFFCSIITLVDAYIGYVLYKYWLDFARVSGGS